MSPQKLAEKYRALIRERMPVIETDHGETGHYYVYEGKRYPSVTKELQTIKDEGLMSWKMNRALDYVLENIDFVKTLHGDDWDRAIYGIVENAKLAPQLEFEGAGNIGVRVHDIREEFFQMWINSPTGTTRPILHKNRPDETPPVMSGIRGIDKFLEDTGYIPVACELKLANHDLGIGGTLDDIGILPYPGKIPIESEADWQKNGYKTKYDPKLCLVDLKTSNIGNKNSYFLQVALYYYMFRKLTGIKCQEFYILHVSKTDGSYKLIPIKNIEQRIKDAKLLLQLNKALRNIEEDKKKETIML